MVDAFNIAKRKELDEKWASFFYQANVPFNVARHSKFIEVVRATSAVRFEYNSPSYHQLRTNLITPKIMQIEKDIEVKSDLRLGTTGCRFARMVGTMSIGGPS